ncbi:DUF1707 domain-containing protein [Glycomyces sp. L485]|uniref:DUF1707 SHOCT-like domain-containing protein n=1 Tax=Glycomyces sp. L485 TaxID=2909235 RepID=UPI001F4B2C51|nr:DUF1707 domain-containing protein [Glycomyces sp. L485]MCH7233118.1 DUF1707 domain-containing protein [Glycomyces sp. L485]
MSSLEHFRDRGVRIGDADRNALSELLRASVDKGYLTLEEYEERVSTVMEAKTVGDAEEVLFDLPAYQAIIETQEPGADPTPPWIKWLWAGVSIPIGINIGVWAFVLALTGGNTQYFWPIWVVMPLLIVAGVLTVAERKIIRPAVDEKRRKECERRRYRR